MSERLNLVYSKNDQAFETLLNKLFSNTKAQIYYIEPNGNGELEFFVDNEAMYLPMESKNIEILKKEKKQNKLDITYFAKDNEILFSQDFDGEILDVFNVKFKSEKDEIYVDFNLDIDNPLITQVEEDEVEEVKSEEVQVFENFQKVLIDKVVPQVIVKIDKYTNVFEILSSKDEANIENIFNSLSNSQTLNVITELDPKLLQNLKYMSNSTKELGSTINELNKNVSSASELNKNLINLENRVKTLENKISDVETAYNNEVEKITNEDTELFNKLTNKFINVLLKNETFFREFVRQLVDRPLVLDTLASPIFDIVFSSLYGTEEQPQEPKQEQVEKKNEEVSKEQKTQKEENQEKQAQNDNKESGA